MKCIDMIKRILIRNVASYDVRGVEFTDLKKVNFIYGGNGCGKTTLSRLLGSSKRERARAFHGNKVEWSGERLRVLVYNKDFREKNLSEIIPGVFIIGEEWAEVEKGLKNLRREWREYESQVLLASNAYKEKEYEVYRVQKKLEDKLWEQIYEPYKDFKKCLKGYGKRASFCEKLLSEVKVRKENENPTRGFKYGLVARDLTGIDIEDLRKDYQRLFVEDANTLEGSAPMEREILTNEVWQYMAMIAEETVDSAMASIRPLQEEASLLGEEANEAERRFSQIDQSLRGTESMIRNQQIAIDNINQLLRNLGFKTFSIQPAPKHDNHYQIQREDGSYVRDTLSEGEMTLITFLYFIQLIRGGMIDLEMEAKRVVVVDDPISSLDNEVAYTIGMLTRDLINDVRNATEDDRLQQIIILTHNKKFHKEVSDRQPRKDTHYWQLYKKDGVSHVKAFGEENPVRGEYEDLWNGLREMKKRIENGNGALWTQNIMRRIIEEYFVGFGGYNRRKLYCGEYIKDERDRMAVVTLTKWLDEGSHGAEEDIYAESQSLKFLELFERFWELMGQGEHYRMMMREESL